MELYVVLILSLFIGSFLNVCIWRIPRKLSIVRPINSYCPRCEAVLTWWQNLPVIGWCLLRAKCGSCKEPISGQYPLVEILATFAGLAVYENFGLTPTSYVLFALIFTLIVITFIDLEHKIIPDVISFPGMTIGLLIGIASQYLKIFQWPIATSALDSLLGFLLGGGFFYVIGLVYYWMTKRVGLGGGDIKYMAMIGALFGWQSILPIIFAGSLIGSIVGIITMLISGSGRHTQIPFGPWLALGTVLYIFVELPFFKM